MSTQKNTINGDEYLFGEVINLNKMHLGIKVTDITIDIAKMTIEPSVANIVKLCSNVIQTCAIYLEQATILSIITAKNFIFDLYQENYIGALKQLIFALSMKMYYQTAYYQGYSTKPLFVIATFSSLYSTMENGKDFINLREKLNQQYEKNSNNGEFNINSLIEKIQQRVDELKNDSFMTDDYHDMLQQYVDELKTEHPNDQSVPAHDEL